MVDVDPHTPLVVDGDVDDLRTAIANLLDNAVKYSSGPPQVTVQAAGPTPDTAWVRVKDAGVGIPRAQLKRIFHPLLSIPGRLQDQGHRPRPLHRPLDRQARTAAACLRRAAAKAKARRSRSSCRARSRLS